MTKIQELEIRQGELREELAGMLDTDADNERVGVLTKELRSLERQITAQRVIEPEPETRSVESKPEDRERLDLEKRANIGDVFGLVINGGAPSGAMAELQQDRHLASNEISIRQLMGLEHRAVTPAPGDVGQNQAPIIPYVFPQAVGSFLGVDMPVVGVGDAVFPVLTSTLSVGTPAENADQADTTGAFSADVLTPLRLQAAYFYSREDRARFAGMDGSLRMNLADGLADGLDRQIMQGTNGLLTGTNLADHDAAAITTFEDYISNFAFGRVDGRYAATTAQVRVVMGAGSYGHAGSVYRIASVDRTALDRLMEITGGVRVSAHVPAVASNKQEAVIRLGQGADMVAPVWENIALIPDEVTKAAGGQIVITAVMLHNVKILRAAGYYKQETQHA